MEIFGILLAIPVAFVVSAVYCFFLERVIARVDKLRRVMWVASLVVMILFGIEVVFLSTLGAVRSYAVIGPGFYAAHLLLFILGTPALANALLLKKPAAVRWYWAVPVSTLFAVGLILLHYGVSEALYGVE